MPSSESSRRISDLCETTAERSTSEASSRPRYLRQGDGGARGSGRGTGRGSERGGVACTSEEDGFETALVADGQDEVPDQKSVVESRKLLAIFGHLVGGADGHLERYRRGGGSALVDALVEDGQHAVKNSRVALENLVHEGHLGLWEHPLSVALEAVLAQGREHQGSEYLVREAAPVEARVEVGGARDALAQRAREAALGRARRPKQQHVLAGDEGQDHAPPHLFAFQHLGAELPLYPGELFAGIRCGHGILHRASSPVGALVLRGARPRPPGEVRTKPRVPPGDPRWVRACAPWGARTHRAYSRTSAYLRGRLGRSFRVRRAFAGAGGQFWTRISVRREAAPFLARRGTRDFSVWGRGRRVP